jgi:uncharacterized protein YwgA
MEDRNRDNNKMILSIAKKIYEVSGELPGKKTMQKMVYLIEQSGVDLGFDYSIHFYGPYSADLDYAIQYLDYQGELDIEITPSVHKISVTDVSGLPELCEKASRVIAEFGRRSPGQLELLSTALYVQRETAAETEAQIINSVVRIKGEKYSSEAIAKAINELQAERFFELAG